MSRTETSPAPPDLRRPVRISAVVSLAALAAAGLSGLIAADGGWGAVLHAALVAVALPVSFLAHLVALVAVAGPPGANAP